MQKKQEFEQNKQKVWQEKGIEKCTFQPDTSKKKGENPLKASVVIFTNFEEPNQIRPSCQEKKTTSSSPNY